MERVITYTVDNPLPRQKVRGFLKLKHYSTHSLKRLRDQPESILVNGEPVFLNHMLRPGDVITVRIREGGVPDGKGRGGPGVRSCLATRVREPRRFCSRLCR